MNKKSNKGFTFIEILIGISILSIVLIYFLNGVIVSKKVREVSTSNITQKAYTSDIVESIKNDGINAYVKNKSYFELNKELKPNDQYIEQIDVTNPKYTTTLKLELDEETKGIKGIAKEKNVFVDDVSYVNLEEHLSNYLKVSGYDGSKLYSNSKIGITFQLDMYNLDENYYKLKVTSEIQGRNIRGNNGRNVNSFPDKLVKYTTEHKVKKDNKITFNDKPKYDLTWANGSQSVDSSKLNKNDQNIVVVEIPRFKYASSQDNAVQAGGVYYDLPTSIDTSVKVDFDDYVRDIQNNLFLSWYPVWNGTGWQTITDWDSIIITGKYHDGIDRDSNKPSVCFVVKQNNGTYKNYFGIGTNKSRREWAPDMQTRSRFIEIWLNLRELSSIKLEDYVLKNPVYVGNIPKIRYMYSTEPVDDYYGLKIFKTNINERGTEPSDRLWFVNGDLDKFLVKSDNKTDDYSDVKYRNYLCTVESVDKKTNEKIKYTFKIPR